MERRSNFCEKRRVVMRRGRDTRAGKVRKCMQKSGVRKREGGRQEALLSPRMLHPSRQAREGHNCGLSGRII
eukprot:552057-Hanusia_phi.AAC.1